MSEEDEDEEDEEEDVFSDSKKWVENFKIKPWYQTEKTALIP